MGTFFKIIGILILAVIVVAAGATGVGIYLMRQPPELAKEMRPVPTTTAAVASFDQKMKSIEGHLVEQQKLAASTRAGGTPGPTPTPIVVTLSEQEVTAKVNEFLRRENDQPAGADPSRGGAPVRDVQLNFQRQDQTVRASGTWELESFSGQLAAEAQTKLVGNKLEVDLKALQVGGAGAPAPIKEQVQATIEKLMEENKIPDWVQGIEITQDGQLSLKIR